MTLTTQPTIRNYTAGTWSIDPAGSEIGFSVRHTVVGRVGGTFAVFSGQLVTGASPFDSCVTAIVGMSSVDTANSRRDDHLRSADFFDVDVYPTMDFRSTAVRQRGPRYVLDGLLTIKGITRAISLDLELRRSGRDEDGTMRMAFSARGALDRSDFGVDFNLVLRVGGILIANRVDLCLDIEAVLNR